MEIHPVNDIQEAQNTRRRANGRKNDRMMNNEDRYRDYRDKNNRKNDRMMNNGQWRREWHRDYWDKNIAPLNVSEIRGDVNLITTMAFYDPRSFKFPMYEGFRDIVSYFPTIISTHYHSSFHLDQFKAWVRREMQWSLDLLIIESVLWEHDNRTRFHMRNCIAGENTHQDADRHQPFLQAKSIIGGLDVEGLQWPIAGTDEERRMLHQGFPVGDFIVTVTSHFWQTASASCRQQFIDAIARTGIQNPAIVIADDGRGFDLNQMKGWLAEATSDITGLALVMMEPFSENQSKAVLLDFLFPQKHLESSKQPALSGV